MKKVSVFLIVLALGSIATAYADQTTTYPSGPMNKTFSPGRKGVADDSVLTTGNNPNDNVRNTGRKGVADDSVHPISPLNTGPNTGSNPGPDGGGSPYYPR